MDAAQAPAPVTIFSRPTLRLSASKLFDSFFMVRRTTHANIIICRHGMLKRKGQRKLIEQQMHPGFCSRTPDFIDDGSADATGQVIGALADSVPPGIFVFSTCTKNCDKI
jgi:hypothetical protein